MTSIISRGKKNGYPTAQVVVKANKKSITKHLVWSFKENCFLDCFGIPFNSVAYPK